MENPEKIIKVCGGKTCSSRFSEYIINRLEADKKFYKYDENIVIEKCICLGKCDFGPNIKIDNEIFSGQNPIKASELLAKKAQEWKEKKR